MKMARSQATEPFYLLNLPHLLEPEPSAPTTSMIDLLKTERYVSSVQGNRNFGIFPFPEKSAKETTKPSHMTSDKAVKRLPRDQHSHLNLKINLKNMVPRKRHYSI
jgi:hypothetical protein